MKRLSLGFAILVIALLPPASAADPSPTFSSVPAWLDVLTPQPWGIDPGDYFTVIVRDEVGNPIPNCPVVLDFGACHHVKFAAEQKVPKDVVVDCGADTMRAMTDAAGTVTFAVYGALVSRDPIVPDTGCLAVYAGFPRVWLGDVSVRTYDLDGHNGLTSNDLSLLFCDFFSGMYYARCDYNGVTGINALDVSLWLQKYFRARGNGRTAARCDSVPAMTPRIEGPAGSLRLAWNACAGDGGSASRSFACNTNTGGETLVASFIAPPGLLSLTGFDAQIWLVAPEGQSIPAWWRLDATGCRANQITGVQAASSCLPLVVGTSGWQIFQQAEYSGGLSLPNVLVIRVTGATTEPPGMPEEGQEYGLFELYLSHAKTTLCSGCPDSIKLMLDWVYLRQSGGGGASCVLPDPNQFAPDVLLRQGPESIAYWQGDHGDTIPLGVGDRPGGAAEAALAVTNPARGSARISLSLPRPMRGTLAIYDVAGRRHRVLLSDALPGGTRTLVWDGRTDEGEPLPGGYYLVRFAGEGATLTRPIVWLR